MTGIIVGVQGDEANKAYRVVLYKRDSTGEQYGKQVVPEQVLIASMNTGKVTLDNAEVVGGKLKGTTGDLARFKANGFHPMVVMSEIVAEDNVIGYRLASYEGKITAVRVKEVLAYCKRVGKNGAPLQNAVYVAASENTKDHIRAFPGHSFYRETIKRRPAPVAKPAQVDKKSNETQVSKLEELFSPAQIKQLKLGKAHGVDIRVFGNNKLSADQMKELRMALESGVNAKAFADPAYSAPSMKALRLNAKYGADITYFVNPKFNAEQIYELSTGFISGIDISKYADPEMSAKEMAKERVYLESQLWREVKASKVEKIN